MSKYSFNFMSCKLTAILCTSLLANNSEQVKDLIAVEVSGSVSKTVVLCSQGSPALKVVSLLLY